MRRVLIAIAVSVCAATLIAQEQADPKTLIASATLNVIAQTVSGTQARIEKFPLGSKQWDGEMGELWMTEPGLPTLITRYRDIATTLASGSRNADVTAELVYVGRGDTAADYAGKDVRGKIVLASGAVGAVHNVAVRQFGAEGVLSYTNATGKPIDRPDQMGWSAIRRS